MPSLMRITEEASSRKSSSLSSLSDHRSSAASLKRGTTGVTGAYIPPFNFEAAKSKVEKGFTASLPGRFTRFFKTPSFDKLARACLQHYLSVAEQQALSTVRTGNTAGVTFSSTVPKGNMALYRAKRQQIDNVNMPVVTAHQGSLAKEEHEQLALLGPLYARVILEQSPYTEPGMRIQPHQDLLFFEALYKAIADIIQEAFLRHPYADIEAHLGKLFRTSCFNIAGHRQQAPRFVDVVPLDDLVELRQGMSRKDPIAARKLNALNSRLNRANYRIASQANTGFVASLLRPSHEAGSGPQKGQSILDKQDSRSVYSVPAAMLDPLDPAENTGVSTDRAGMITDAQLKQLRLLRNVLSGRDPSAEGKNVRLGSTMRNLSVLRGSVRPAASSLSMAS